VLQPDRTSVTYRYESYRAVSAGIVETASATFLLLIAVRWFHAGAFAKGCIAAGSGVGYLITPFVVSTVETLRIPAAQAASRLAFTGALALGLATLIAWLPLFVLTTMVAMAAAGALIPLLTQIYQDNYPEAYRGRFFSRTVMIRIASAAAFSFAGGQLLAANIGLFRAVLALLTLALAFSGWCLRRIPSQPLHQSGGSHPLRAMQYAYADRMFRITLMSWMLMGFANLMMLPLRVEYLANARYGLSLGADTVALLTGVVPNLARLALSPFWGWLFDRSNFFVLRMSVNVGFALGIASFFTSDTMPGLILSAVIFGVSVAGGDVAWSLWVTKVAPPQRVADYMSVHTFFTGTRALAAPFAGFWLAAHWSLASIGWLSSALILAATLLLLPEVKQGRLIRGGGPPTTPPLPADEGRP
jgi:hypothetical protein